MPDDAIERAVRIAVWNVAKSRGMADDVIYDLINKTISEPTLAKALAFASQQAPDGWRPIDTAPKDGRYIDVARYADDFGWIVGVSYWVKDLGGGWISKGTGPFGELGLAHPTHWQPRPTPPAMLDAAPSVTLGEVG